MRSKRNFHRPPSNSGMALNCGWRVFIVLQSRLKLQIHQSKRKNATSINGLSTANQKAMFQSEFSGVGLLFMLFSQASEDRHFRKCEVSFAMLPQYRARQLRYVPSQDSDVLFG